jgi:hypothetical protein
MDKETRLNTMVVKKVLSNKNSGRKALLRRGCISPTQGMESPGNTKSIASKAAYPHYTKMKDIPFL